MLGCPRPNVKVSMSPKPYTVFMYVHHFQDLKQQNELMLETKSLLEQKAASLTARAAMVDDLQTELASLRAQVEFLTQEKELSSERVEELMAQLTHVELDNKNWSEHNPPPSISFPLPPSLYLLPSPHLPSIFFPLPALLFLLPLPPPSISSFLTYCNHLYILYTYHSQDQIAELTTMLESEREKSGHHTHILHVYITCTQC